MAFKKLTAKTEENSSAISGDDTAEMKVNVPSDAGEAENNDVKTKKRVTVVTPTLTEFSWLNGALFQREPSTGDDDDDGPAYSGRVRVIEDEEEGVEFSISGFIHYNKDTGERYLSISLGDENQAHYYGKIFRQRKSGPPKYSGFLTVLRLTKPKEHDQKVWEEAPKLKIVAEAKRYGVKGKPYISLKFMPTNFRDDELLV